ncbi:MAG TPA: VWA domain-containing protein [Streptosporangiaceae bacterium]|nr:VWA domain-containing protein [Streptosporangiaceae bacterium]
MSLLDRHADFVAALRGAGLPVSPVEGLDAVRAMAVIDLGDRESLRAAYAGTLVKSPAHRATFDTLFDLWFPPVIGSGDSEPGAGAPEEDRPAPGAAAGAAASRRDPELNALRDRLAELLLAGDDAGLRGLARTAVARYGRAPAAPGRQSWFSFGVLRALSPETLMARLLRETLAGRERGGMAERVARQTLTSRIARFEDMIAADVRRRIAEESGIERIARASVRPPLERLDFLRATRADLAALRRAVYPLARRLATRLAARQRRGRRGRLDFRRTMRSSLSTGGVPVITHHRPPRPHRPELVVICDVSDSVAAFAHFTLLLTFALREQFTKVRAFAFVDTLDEITRFFAPGTDIVEAMTRLAREANVTRLSGRTNYGHAIEVFAERYAAGAVGPKTSLLILGDARSNYGPLATDTLTAIVDKSRHAYWLNPEPRADWDTADSAASTYGEIVPMYECRNVAQLTEFIQTIG